MSRAIFASVTCGEVMCTPATPPRTITSASPKVAQQMPSAPAAIWRRAIASDLCVLACGRSAMPRPRACAAIAAILRSSASRSTTSAGVSSRARLPGWPMREALGPKFTGASFDYALRASLRLRGINNIPHPERSEA